MLDVKTSVILHIFKYINQSKAKPSVLKTYGLIDGRIDRYDFPLVETANLRQGDSLTFQKMCDYFDPSLSQEDKNYIFSAAYRTEIPLLVAYAMRKVETLPKDKSELLEAISNAINSIDGTNDLFIGTAYQYAFENSKNIICWSGTSGNFKFNYEIEDQIKTLVKFKLLE